MEPQVCACGDRVSPDEMDKHKKTKRHRFRVGNRPRWVPPPPGYMTCLCGCTFREENFKDHARRSKTHKLWCELNPSFSEES
jgi:hypothetical protein